MCVCKNILDYVYCIKASACASISVYVSQYSVLQPCRLCKTVSVIRSTACFLILYVVMAAHRYPYIRSIVQTLNSVTRPGSFANGGAFQLPLPALKITGVDGVVRLPVSDAQAKAIIAVCSQAPYGRGEETIVDTSVRNTWQLDPAHFTIMNPEWNSAIKSLAAVVERELGCDPSLNVCCELHKFLLYEQGSFFKVFRMYHMNYIIIIIIVASALNVISPSNYMCLSGWSPRGIQ